MVEVRRDWWGELDDMQRQMERFVEHFNANKRPPVIFTAGSWQPLVDVYQVGEQVFVVCELSGVQREEVNIVLHNNTLLLSGVRHDSRAGQRRIYQVMEVNYGRFERAIELPITVEPDSASAELENGFLVITLKQAPEPTMKRVQLRTGSDAGERQEQQ